MSRRIPHLDVAKGIGALLVVIGHNWLVWGEKGELFDVVFSFHIPLFFFLSGVFFRPSDPVHRVTKERAKSLLKPYLVTFALLAIDDVLLATDADALRYFGGVAYGTGGTIPWTPLWFLPHLWVLSIVVLLVCRTTRFAAWPEWSQAVFILLMLGVGVTGIECFWEVPMQLGTHRFELPGLPLSMDIVLISGAFFLGGYFFREPLTRGGEDGGSPAAPASDATVPATNESVERWGFVIALSTFVAIHVVTDTTMDVNYRRYDHAVITTIAAASGIYLTIAVSRVITRLTLLRRALSYVGSASLFVLIFHHPVQFKSFEFFETHLTDSRHVAAGLAFVVATLVPLAIFEVVRRVRLLRALYLP